MRGDGRVFQRGARWWIAYYATRGGKAAEYREPAFIIERTGEEPRPARTKQEAQRALRERRREIQGDRFIAPPQRRVTVGSLLDDLLTHVRTKGARSADKTASHLQAVRRALGDRRAAEVTTPMVEHYVEERLGQGRARATVNRELEGLRQALTLAARRTPPLLAKVPYIPLLKVENARQGFLSRADFEALLAQLSDADVRDFLEWFWWTGMRPGEIRQLTWAMLDRETWTLHLDPKAAKIGKGRSIPVSGPLRQIMERRVRARRLDCALIFHRTSKGEPGQPIRDFMRQWRAALKTASLPPGLQPYDLRRSALRNMIRGGTDFTVAMKISGHRTRSTFDRYNIVSEEDLRAAVERTAAYVSQLPTERKVVAMATRAGNERGQNTDKDASGVPPAPSRLLTDQELTAEELAEAGGNRTHRCRCQPAAGRL